MADPFKRSIQSLLPRVFCPSRNVPATLLTFFASKEKPTTSAPPGPPDPRAPPKAKR